MAFGSAAVPDSSEPGAERFSVEFQDGEPVWATCQAYIEYCLSVMDEIAFRDILKRDGGGLLIPTRGSEAERFLVQQWMR